MTSSNEVAQNGDQTLDQKVGEATSWTLALGGLGIIASILQMLDVVEAGVPGWLNLLIAGSAVGLGLLLSHRSLLITGALLAIFMAIIADTLITTGIVFDEWGLFPTIILIFRYLILLSAARSVGQVFAGIISERTTSRRVAALGVSASERTVSHAVETLGAPSEAERATAKVASPSIEPGTNASAIYFRVLGGLVAVGGIFFGFAMTSEGEAFVGLIGFIVGPLFGAGVFYLAGIEARYLPGLVVKLKTAVELNDKAAIQNARTKLIAAKHHASRRLAAELVNEKVPINSPFGQIALETISEIGTLDKDAAIALRRTIADKSALSDETQRVLGY